MSNALLDELIATIANVVDPHTRPAPDDVPRDPKWKLHRAQVLAAATGRDLCAYPHCMRPTGEPGETFCHRHAIDDVAVEQAIAGQPQHLMRHERLEAVRRMRHAGDSWTAIQDRLHVSGATITAALKEHQ